MRGSSPLCPKDLIQNLRGILRKIDALGQFLQDMHVVREHLTGLGAFIARNLLGMGDDVPSHARQDVFEFVAVRILIGEKNASFHGSRNLVEVLSIDRTG